MSDVASTPSLLALTTDSGNSDNSSTTDINVDEYLTMYLGTRYRSTWAAVSLSVIYCVVLMTGIT